MDRLNAEEEQIKPEASFVEDLGADSLTSLSLSWESKNLTSRSLMKI